MNDLYEWPINYGIAYQYSRAFLALAIGDLFGKPFSTEELVETADEFISGWVELTGASQEELRHVMLVGARRISDDEIAARSPRIEHFAAAIGLILGRLSRHTRDYEATMAELLQENPLPDDYVDKWRWVGRRQRASGRVVR